MTSVEFSHWSLSLDHIERPERVQAVIARIKNAEKNCGAKDKGNQLDAVAHFTRRLCRRRPESGVRCRNVEDRRLGQCR